MSKPAHTQSWTIEAIDSRSRWDEHEAAVGEISKRWRWTILALEIPSDARVEVAARARLALGRGKIVSPWGNA